MSSHAGNTDAVELRGILRWNEFEGGFWSLELTTVHPELGDRVDLSGFDPAPSTTDGSSVIAIVVPRPELIGFTMAGPKVEVLELRPA